MSGYREALEAMVRTVSDRDPLMVRADERTGHALALVPSPADANALLLVAIDPEHDTAALKLSRDGVEQLHNALDRWLGTRQ